MKGMYPLMVDVCHEMKEHVKHNLGTPIEVSNKIRLKFYQ